MATHKSESGSLAKDSLNELSLSPQIDPQKEKNLRRKLDLIILPIATLCYALNFLDRGLTIGISIKNIGNARNVAIDQQGLSQTLAFIPMIYYVTYLVFEIPLALLIKKAGFVVVPISIVMFGLVTLGTAFIEGHFTLIQPTP
ncbi:hypothetical protein VNI00_014934 [Paramarasmius palmivorus]|uniref:Uncharacterized protein n=1 Tax=Paramarasmius palmivorus TaxID=297713 RepID=A0AAW0BNT1_9AGAR